MDAAVAEYRSLMHGPFAWMVRRFVCPVAWLPELLALLPESVEEPWRIAVLGTSAEGFKQDLSAIERFEEAAAGRALVESYEVRTAPNLSLSTLKSMANAGFEEVFLEVPWDDSMMDALHQLVEVEGIGAKLRTGGLEPAAFPPPRRLAEFLHECLSLDLPFKLTAGLHHPFPHVDQKVNARMFGFVPVQVAVALGLRDDWTIDEMTALLESDDTSGFQIEDRAVRYGDHVITASDLEAMREFFVAWGSCSVEEPVEDLRAAGWIENEG